MGGTTSLSPEKVREQMSALQTERENARKLVEENEKVGRQIDSQIRELQAQCPHENAKEDWVQDVAEMKLRNFCTDCGAQVR